MEAIFVTVEETEAAIERLLARVAVEPDYLPHHQAAYRCAQQRKMLGGKPADLLARLRPAGKTSIERLISAERLWL